jgi:hypothetical protein
MESKTFYIKSGGAAYDLDVGFVCDRVDVKNLTQWETDTKEIEHHWNKYMLDGYAYSELVAVAATNRKINTTNGFTPIDTNDVTDNQDDVVGISQAALAVCTATAHGFGVAGAIVTVLFKGVLGMLEVNSNYYKATIIDANSFSLTTMDGINLNSTGFSAYTSGGLVLAVSLTVEDAGFAGINLGSVIMGSNDDILEVTCYSDDFYLNLGDVAT